MAQALCNSLTVSRKSKHGTTEWPSNFTLGILSQRIKIYIHTTICTRMFTAALSVIIKNQSTGNHWKKRRCYISRFWKDGDSYLRRGHVLDEGETCKKERVAGKDKLAEFSRKDAGTLAHWEEPNPTFAETRTMCEAWDTGECPGR